MGLGINQKLQEKKNPDGYKKDNANTNMNPNQVALSLFGAWVSFTFWETWYTVASRVGDYIICSIA